MRKKTMAILLAGAVAAAGIIGLTACKDGDDNGLAKGEKVSEEQWRAAITATAETDSYTLTNTVLMQDTATGKVGDKTVTANYIYTDTTTSYYNLTDKKYYSESTATEKLTGGELIGEEDGEESETEKEYIEAEELAVWYAEFDEEANEWDAYSYSVSSADSLTEVFERRNSVSFLMHIKLATTLGGEAVFFEDLYSAFSYDNGYYSATLYDGQGTEAKVTVSIKGGYIIGLMQEATGERTDETTGLTTTSTMKYTYSFSNFGSTTVTAPTEAAAAIAAAKTPSNN